MKLPTIASAVATASVASAINVDFPFGRHHHKRAESAVLPESWTRGLDQDILTCVENLCLPLWGIGRGCKEHHIPKASSWCANVKKQDECSFYQILHPDDLTSCIPSRPIVREKWNHGPHEVSVVSDSTVTSTAPATLAHTGLAEAVSTVATAIATATSSSSHSLTTQTIDILLTVTQEIQAVPTSSSSATSASGRFVRPWWPWWRDHCQSWDPWGKDECDGFWCPSTCAEGWCPGWIPRIHARDIQATINATPSSSLSIPQQLLPPPANAPVCE